jgi:periplasmic copper chaperone A
MRMNSRTTSRGTAVLALWLLPLLAGHAAAADYKVGPLQITQPWARATPRGAASGAAYMTVTNTGNTAERLNCVSSDASAKCQMHEMTMENGVMRMRPLEGGLQIKPGESVTLKPGGYHVMLLNLKAPLQQGKTVEATLKTSDGATVQVQFPIAAIGAPAPGNEAGGGMMMQDHGGMQMNKQ